MTSTSPTPGGYKPLRLTGSTLLVLLLCSGCQVMPQAPKVDVVTAANYHPSSAVSPTARPVTGGLYSAASYRPAFEDRRARAVGDSLTIQIVENISASQKSSSTIDRTASVDASVAALPFTSKSVSDKLTANASSANTFAGKGGTESANTFSGSITATVIDVLPNGHLVVSGDKQIGVNQNVDVLRFSGTVDPKFVLPGSVVNSTQVANARIESRGRGAQDEAQTIGWLSRFFLTIMPF